MGVANLVSGLYNRLSQEWTDGFVIENFWVGRGQKWLWPVWWRENEKWTNRITDFACWYRFRFFLGWHGQNWVGQSCHGTLELALSQKWTNGINWFFACWCTFRKAKSGFSYFWMGMVKNVHDLLVLETPSWEYCKHYKQYIVKQIRI